MRLSSRQAVGGCAGHPLEGVFQCWLGEEVPLRAQPSCPLRPGQQQQAVCAEGHSADLVWTKMFLLLSGCQYSSPWLIASAKAQRDRVLRSVVQPMRIVSFPREAIVGGIAYTLID